MAQGLSRSSQFLCVSLPSAARAVLERPRLFLVTCRTSMALFLTVIFFGSSVSFAGGRFLSSVLETSCRLFQCEPEFRPSHSERSCAFLIFGKGFGFSQPFQETVKIKSTNDWSISSSIDWQFKSVLSEPCRVLKRDGITETGQQRGGRSGGTVVRNPNCCGLTGSCLQDPQLPWRDHDTQNLTSRFQARTNFDPHGR